jgi:Glutaredoxin-like domain (DUF836)
MQHSLTLYYRNNCHLCDQMLTELHALYGDRMHINLVDVDTDMSLQARFGLQVPVLMGGTEILGIGAIDRALIEEYLSIKRNQT